MGELATEHPGAQLGRCTDPYGNALTYTLDNPGRVVKIAAADSWNNGETPSADSSYVHDR